MKFYHAVIYALIFSIVLSGAAACGVDESQNASVPSAESLSTVELTGTELRPKPDAPNDTAYARAENTDLTTENPVEPRPLPTPALVTEPTPPSETYQPLTELPPVSLKLERSEYPVVDGSTATIPLSVALARSVTGMSQLEAEGFVFHNKTTQSFMYLAMGMSDVLLVYAPAESIFERTYEAYGLSKDDFVITPIGRDALVFLVNEQNPVKSLTSEQLLGIYTGKTKKWSELTLPTDVTTGEESSGEIGAPPVIFDDIIAFQRNEESGSQVMMKNLLMKDIPMAEAPAERRHGEMGGLIEGIAEYNNSGNAIGYSVYYYFKNMYNIEGVRALGVDGAPCDDEHIASGEYPLTQDFYAVIRRDEPQDSAARKLYNLITGHEGAGLIKAAGYTPIHPSGGGSQENGRSAADAADIAKTADVTGVTMPYSESDRSASMSSATPQTSTAYTSRNVFPLEVSGKIGFIDGNTDFVIEPKYDIVRKLAILDGEVYYGLLTAEGAPIYYCATVYCRNGDGITDYTKYEYSEIIGEDGKVIYHTDDPYAGFHEINIKDKSIIGSKSSDTAGEIKEDAYPEYHTFFLFDAWDSDGGDSAARIVDFFDTTLSERIYDGNRRLLNVHSNGGGDEEVYLADLYGKRLTKEPYDYLYDCHDGKFIFITDGYKPVVVNGDGEEVFRLPDDVRRLNCFYGSGMYAYTSADKTVEVVVSDEERYLAPLFGLMDSGFGKVTEPLWTQLIECTDKVFAAQLPKDDNDSPSRWILIDRSGKQLNDNYYGTVNRDIRGQNSRGKNGYETDDSEDYITVLSTEEDLAAEGAFISHNVSQLLNEDGDVLFEDTDQQRFEYIIADKYAVMSYSEEGFSDNEPDGDYTDFKIPRVMGLKKLKAVTTLNDNAPESWLLPPVYYTIYQDNADGRFILATGGNGNAEHYTVFDTETEKVMFSGDYRELQFAGYPAVGDKAAAVGNQLLFYAETSMRRGYLNQDGEWLISVSIFDTL